MCGFTVFAFLGILPVFSLAAVSTIPNVEVTYAGMDEKYATAMAETLAAARLVYIEQYKFDMPEKVFFEAKCRPGESTRLYTDGQDRLFLFVPSVSKLAKPASSGVFNLYGMCHELGHMAMYRTLRNRDWMTSAAAEGFAHYVGSVVVDKVYAAKGEKLWPDPYDYRQDGMARLRRQLDGSNPSSVAQGAGRWLALESIIGQAGFPKLFAAWQEAKVDPADPDGVLRETLVKLMPEKKAALEDWWKTAGPLFVEKRAASEAKAVEIPLSQLALPPLMIKPDDGTMDGKKSVAGGGHARRFHSPGGGPWYVKAISVYGARYGHPQAPKEDFDIVLCDGKMAAIAPWKKPYGAFARGDMKWVRLEVPPTRVPDEFHICLDFKPTATKGVYVGYDNSTHGNSQVATPGKSGSDLSDGDWMIRLELAQPKGADPLRAQP